MSKAIPFYLRIEPRITSGARLAHLRALAANEHKQDWRAARAWNLGNWYAAYGNLSQGSRTDGKTSRAIWYSHMGPHFRNEQFADEIDGARIGHTGWFSDSDQRATFRGIVCNLSHGRFIAGYYWSDNGERVYFDRVFDDAVEAARYADGEAESIAESEREYDERWQAAHRLNDEIDDHKTRASELFALRNMVQFKGTARDELREVLDDIRAKRERLADEFKDIEI
jgi:hypothetical protein